VTQNPTHIGKENAIRRCL